MSGMANASPEGITARSQQIWLRACVPAHCWIRQSVLSMIGLPARLILMASGLVFALAECSAKLLQLTHGLALLLEAVLPSYLCSRATVRQSSASWRCDALRG